MEKVREIISAIKKGDAKIVNTEEIRKKKVKIEKENVQPKMSQEEALKELIPSPPREPIILRMRKGIQKVQTKVMTDPEAMEIIRENHKKKEEKKKQAAHKEKVAKKAISDNRKMTLRQKKAIKMNPKL